VGTDTGSVEREAALSCAKCSFANKRLKILGAAVGKIWTRAHGMTARHDVLSYIPCIQATQPPSEGVRRGAVGGNKPGQKAHSLLPSDSFGSWRPRKGRPRPFAEDRGLSAEWGERGWGLGGTPTRHEPYAAAPIQFLPPHLVFECAAAPRRRDAVKHF
jgi:hypothetical protein